MTMHPRRTVTVLFTDLVDSTRLLTAVPLDESEHIRVQHFGYMRNALAVHRGQEVKTVGDSFMAVFQSAGDALSCSVTMQRSVARHARESGYPLAIRIGIDVGDATFSEGDYFGAAVITASRLCGTAGAADIYVTDTVLSIAGGTDAATSVGALDLKGLSAPTPASRLHWDGEESGLRVALIDDSALLRAGISKSLVDEGIEVVLEAGDAEELEAKLDAADPQVVVLDVRMPPTYTNEGLAAAQRIKELRPDMGVLVLSAEVHLGAAKILLANTTSGVGYLLKDRVADIDELTEAIRAIARGGAAIDPQIVGLLGP